jgi:cardiolipin synthase (CMP-forming)
VRHIPNLICLARILLIWPTLVALHDGRYGLTLLLFGIAAVSDGVDGFLAKRYQWTSELGKFLDPLADKLLLVSMFVAAAWLGIVPWWLAAASIARDVMIGVGALIYRLWFGPLHGRPTIISKVNTGMQITYLILAIAAAAFALPPREILDVLALAAFATTLASGADYLALFVRRAWWLPADSR